MGCSIHTLRFVIVKEYLIGLRHLLCEDITIEYLQWPRMGVLFTHFVIVKSHPQKRHVGVV